MIFALKEQKNPSNLIPSFITFYELKNKLQIVIKFIDFTLKIIIWLTL